ncbi:MAG TPA: type II secretion system protein GspM [Methylovirgula sp.]|nr:type II secretion system protein GspM [Methylovirgula sp.]
MKRSRLPRIDFSGLRKAGNRQIGKTACAVMLLGLIYVVALGANWISSDALATMQTNYEARRDLLTALERRSHIGRTELAADAALSHRDPFFSAVTETLAAAQLDDELRRDTVAEQGVVLSSHAGINHDAQSAGKKIEIKAVIEGKIATVQALLFRLETSAPMIFVEELNMEPKGDAQRGVIDSDPTLQANLTLAAYWHDPNQKGMRK